MDARKYGAVVAEKNFFKDRHDNGLVQLNLFRLNTEHTVERERLDRSGRRSSLLHANFALFNVQVDNIVCARLLLGAIQRPNLTWRR